MRPSNNTGFTIIETMLFLGITGLLVVGLLVGTGTSINTQRYRDSVSTFMAFLQKQYSDVANVSNDRANDVSCGSDGQVKEGGSTEARGQSDCFIVGRLIMIDSGQITTYDVNGVIADNVQGSDVVKLNKNYNYGISPASKQSSSLEWDAKIIWPVEGAGSKTEGTNRVISILIMRSPDSGSVYTFTSDETSENITSDVIKGLISSANQGRRTICVDTATGLPAGDKLAVFISDNAANGTAVETRSYQTIQSLGGDTKC